MMIVIIIILKYFFIKFEIINRYNNFILFIIFKILLNKFLEISYIYKSETVYFCRRCDAAFLEGNDSILIRYVIRIQEICVRLR